MFSIDNGFIQSFERVIIILVIIIVAIIAAKTVGYFVRRTMNRSAEMLKVDRTKFAFLRHAVSALIYIAAFILIVYSVPKFRSLAVSMFAGAGLLALVIGLASQQAFSNIISGVFMVLSKPFMVGDRIEVGTNLTGIVEDITLRHTIIRNFENRRIVIPNSIIAAETIINSHLNDEKIRRQIDVSVDYQTDIDLAMKLLMETCLNHPKCIDNRTPEELQENAPVVDVRLMTFQDSGILIRAYAWANNHAESFDLHTDVNRTIKKVYDENGITFPFPQRTISFRNEENHTSLQKIADNGKEKQASRLSKND